MNKSAFEKSTSIFDSSIWSILDINWAYRNENSAVWIIFNINGKMWGQLKQKYVRSKPSKVHKNVSHRRTSWCSKKHSPALWILSLLRCYLRPATIDVSPAKSIASRFALAHVAPHPSRSLSRRHRRSISRSTIQKKSSNVVCYFVCVNVTQRFCPLFAPATSLEFWLFHYSTSFFIVAPFVCEILQMQRAASSLLV